MNVIFCHVRFITCTTHRRYNQPFQVCIINKYQYSKMDYEKELAADFDSDSEDSIIEELQEPVSSNHNERPQNLDQLLQNPKMASIGAKLDHFDVTKMTDVDQISVIHPLIPQIRIDLEKYAGSIETDYYELLASINDENQSEDFRFLMQLSELPTIINDEIALLHRYVSVHYMVVFAELESLVSSPVDYCRIVIEIGQKLTEVRQHEQNLKKILSGDKVLAIVMAALQNYEKLFELREEDMANILKACQYTIELYSFLGEVSEFIADKVSKFAPNVANLIGAVATSQLLISIGSLKQLALTPACNLPSFGVRDLLSQTQTRSNFIRATGYLYYCEVVKGLPPEVVKQALRILSGKVVLAARVDLAGTYPGGDLGTKYLQEVQSKIDKLLTPPEHTAPKALPVPKEQKSKKRGGRRFRKMKERFQMSELRKAQNKMEFGKQEDVVMDSFGEEVGLGMSHQMEGIQVNRNTDARLSKAMINRLQQQKRREDLDTIVMNLGDHKKQEQNGQWGRMKKRRLDDVE